MHMRKGQVQIMEYILLSFFVILVIVIATLLLTGWQITTARSEQQRVFYDRAEFILRAFTNSPYINKAGFKEGSMMEDSKLTAITCGDLQKLYGDGWYASIETLEFKDECDYDNYPLCGKWVYCMKDQDATSFELPVNVYRKSTGEVDAAILIVGLYN